MLIDVLQNGTIGTSIIVFITDNSTSQGKTGLAFGTAGLKIYYARYRSAPVGISLVTQTVNGAWASGGFVEIDAGNLPGHYRLDLPDVITVAGVSNFIVGVTGAGTRDAMLANIKLVSFDPNNNVLETLTSSLVTSGSIGKKIASDGLELSAAGMNNVVGYVP